MALETQDGNLYAGRYAKNAFNPSLPPLQAALILLNLSGGDCLNIRRRAVLVEPQEAILSQWDATRATLAALGCQNVSRAAF